MGNLEQQLRNNKLHILFACAILLFACDYGYRISETDDKSRTLDSTIVNHSEIEKFIQPYRDSIDKSMSEIIGESESFLNTQQPQGTLGNFVCDLVLEDIPLIPAFDFLKSEIHFVVFNTRGLRAPIPIGKISLSTIYQVMPFENEIVLVNMPNGSDKEVMDVLAKKGGHPISRNAKLVADQKKAELFLVNNKKIDDDYWIITSDYLAFGGDDLSFFNQAKEIIPTNIKVRDAIIHHIKKLTSNNKKVNAELDERTLFFR